MAKRVIVVIMFVAMVSWLLTSFNTTAQNSVCQNCTWTGKITKCNGFAAEPEGNTAGNCITTRADAKYIEGQGTVNCVVTEFYNCQGTTEQPGCPIGEETGC